MNNPSSGKETFKMKYFVHDGQAPNAGSIQAVVGYVRAGDELGHNIALYGDLIRRTRGSAGPTEFSAFDRVVLIVEDSISWLSGLP